MLSSGYFHQTSLSHGGVSPGPAPSCDIRKSAFSFRPASSRERHFCRPLTDGMDWSRDQAKFGHRRPRIGRNQPKLVRTRALVAIPRPAGQVADELCGRYVLQNLIRGSFSGERLSRGRFVRSVCVCPQHRDLCSRRVGTGSGPALVFEGYAMAKHGLKMREAPGHDGPYPSCCPPRGPAANATSSATAASRGKRATHW